MLFGIDFDKDIIERALPCDNFLEMNLNFEKHQKNYYYNEMRNLQGRYD